MSEFVGVPEDINPHSIVTRPGEVSRISFDVPDEHLDQVLALIGDLLITSNTTVHVSPVDYVPQAKVGLDEPLKAWRSLLGNTAYNTLTCYRANFRTFGDLVSHTERQLMSIPGFGDGSLANVKGALAELGLSLTEEPSRD